MSRLPADGGCDRTLACDYGAPLLTMAFRSSLRHAAAPKGNALFLVLIVAAGIVGTGRALAGHLARVNALNGELTHLDATFPESVTAAAGETAWTLSLGIAGLGLALALLGGGFATWSVRRIASAAREANAKQELLEATVENLGQGVSVVDGDLRVVMFNRRFLELLDFPPDRFSPGDPFEKFIRHNAERGEYGPGDVETMVRERLAAARRRVPDHVERTRPDGTVLEIRRQPLPSGGFLTTYRDITAERRTQAALEASEQRTRVVLDRALDAVVTIDAGERIIGFNAAAEATFGWPRDEALGRRLSELIIPERFRARHRAGLARYLGGGKTRMIGRRRELTALRASGEEFPVEITVVANTAGDAPIFTAFLRDITARKETEAARRAAEKRLWAFLDGSPQPVSLKDTEGRYVLCNAAFETMTGISRERLAGLTDYQVFPQQPGLHETIRDHEAEAIQSGRPVRQFREWRDTENRMRSFVIVKFPVFGAEGELVGVGTVNQDVTELKNAEAQLRQAQKMQALGLLTGGVAHDFNNLLAVVLGNLELLAERLETEPQTHQLAVAAIGAARRGAALTQRLLAFARQQPLAPRPVALPGLLEDMSDLLQKSLGPEIRLEIECQPGLRPCYVDRAQLETALLNLAVNARDAMPGGGTLTIEAANAPATALPPAQADEAFPGGETGGDIPEARAGKAAVTISVTDTGTGMSPETVDRAFEPFFTTKPVGKGSGLGLSMVYGFVRQSGGQASIVSAPGRGSRIALSLPAAGTVEDGPDEQAPGDREPGSGTSRPTGRGGGDRGGSR